MRMLPSTVHNFQSNAERKVFELLRETDLGPNAFAMHSLNLSKHEYKRWGEIDFVVVWEQGVYALEVKGGRVSCFDGIWNFTNRFNETHRKSEGPFDQAKSGLEALRSGIKQHPGHPAYNSFCWGWCVMFPDIVFDISSVAWSPELIVDLNKLANRQNLSHYLRGLAKWWRSQGSGHSALAGAREIAALQQALRPDFDKLPSISAAIDQAHDAIVRLTDEQISVLDSIDENNRILCTGGAGTGKSFLAVEAARREASADRRTILLCRSPVFAAFLRSRVRNNKVIVSDFDSVESFIASKSFFDVLIVDEAQDLLTATIMARLDHLLKNGLEHGRWRMFLDPNNQSGLHGSMEPEVLERLHQLAAKHRLKRNCRNTKQIVLQTQLLTGADIGVAVIDGQGPPIEVIDVTDRLGTATILEKRIHDWLDNGVRPGQITILSPVELSESAVWLFSDRLKSQLVKVDANTAKSWPPTTVTYSTIRDFKGMENHCIAVVDLDNFTAVSADIAALYVAMTRAHAGLWLGVPAGQRLWLNQLITQHTKQMIMQGNQR